MDRRTFLNWVGLGAIASSLPIAIAACGGAESTSTEPTSTGSSAPDAAPAGDTVASGGDMAVGSVDELNTNGFILNEDVGDGVMVIRDPANPDALIAVNPTCPHAGCVVDWDSGATKFICPCHDSQFEPTGAVVQGPATTDLATYAVTIDGDQIKLAG